jgi:hypothetical protein
MRNIALATTNLLGDIPPIIDITDTLPKEQPWEVLRKPYRHKGHWDQVTYHTGFRNPKDITAIVIHHTGSPESSLESHAKYHMRKWGAGLAYHIAIDQDRIFQTNNLLSFTYHVGNHNTYTIGIVVNRDLSRGDLTSDERRLLYAAILSVKALLPIQHIYAHSELNKTACPMTNVERIRQDIANLEEKINFVENIPEHNRAAAAYTRMADLREKYEGTGPFKEEAKRKLLLIDEVLRQKGFYN